MGSELQGKKIAILVANEGIEEVEMTRPIEAIRQAGGEVEIVAPEVGKVQCFNHLDKSQVMESDRATSQAKASDYDGVMLPGGVANPDQLRMDSSAVSFVREAWNSGLPIAAICHAPWTLVEAGIVKNLSVTSWPSLKTDIRNAGGNWVDQEVCTDQGLVTSRNPGDLDAFCSKIVEEFREGNHSSRRKRVDA